MGNEHTSSSQGLDLPKLQPYGYTSNSTVSALSITSGILPSPSLQGLPSKNSSKNSSIYQDYKIPDESLDVNNGITNKYISSRIGLIASQFWATNIESKCLEDQVEIAVSIYLGMMVSDESMKSVLRSNNKQNENIETLAIRFLNNLGWLLRALMRNDLNLHEILTNLGILHSKMGVKQCHFNSMLKSMHETFEYYFQTKYKIKVKYAMDNVFEVIANIMMGESNTSNIRKSYCSSLIKDDCLKSLNHCLKSAKAREYLYKYLNQTWCDEIAIYLQSISKFKQQTTDKGRFIIARDIVAESINSESNIPLNISYECRNNTLSNMKAFENKFLIQEEIFKFPSDFFMMVDMEIYKLIIDNHWSKFVDSLRCINRVRASSVTV